MAATLSGECCKSFKAMSEDEKNQEKKLPRESFEEFCKRLGIRIVNEKGGMEFVPYRGPQKAARPVPEQHKD
jgi:hypothetical protein